MRFSRFCSFLSYTSFLIIFSAFAALDANAAPSVEDFLPSEAVLEEQSRHERQIQESLRSRYSSEATSAKVEWSLNRSSVSRIFELNLNASRLDPKHTSISKENAMDVARAFIAQNETQLGISAKDLRKEKVWYHSPTNNVKRSEAIVRMSQWYQDLPVVGGQVVVVFDNNSLRTYKSGAFADIKTDIVPKYTREQAFLHARNLEVNQGHLGLPVLPKEEELAKLRAAPRKDQVKLLNSELVILPKSDRRGVLQHYLAWKLTLVGTKEFPFSAVYYIDAHTGFFLARKDLAQRGDVWGKVRGGNFPTYPSNSNGIMSIEPLKGVVVRAQNLITEDIFESVTDDQGSYEFDGVITSQPHSYSFNLTGFADDIFDFAALLDDQYNPPLQTTYSGGAIVLNDSNDQNFNAMTENFYDPINQATNIVFQFTKLRNFFGRGFSSPFDFFSDYDPIRTAVIVNTWNALSNPGSDTSFSSTCSGLLTPSQEQDYNACFLFQKRVQPPYAAEEAAALDLDTIAHEFGHFIQYLIDPSVLTAPSTIDKASTNEGLCDYWAATITDDPLLFEGVAVHDRRMVSNPLRLDLDFDHLADYGHQNGLILAGALWDLRVQFKARYGDTNGREMADEYLIKAMKQGNWGNESFPFNDFGEVLLAMLQTDDSNFNLNDGSPNRDLICHAFCTNHKICTRGINPQDWDCNHSISTVPPTPIPPEPTPRLNKINVPVKETFIDDIFSQSLGSASAPSLASFTLGIRPFGSTGPYNTLNTGSSGVINGFLGPINPSALINGCYYDINLTSSAADGSTINHSVTIKQHDGIHDEMPRMVCLYRTGQEGSENDACEAIALVSDPKPGYYQLSTNDWRRGRSHLLEARPNYQYHTAFGAPNFFGAAICDPDNANGDCLRDCWNITGTGGNFPWANDGRKDVFCKANSGCSPVSFSGCPSEDSTCINNAAQQLEAVYHKVMYFHYANWDNWAPWFRSVRKFANCSDDNGDQFYSLLGADGWVGEASDNIPNVVLWRSGQYSSGRVGTPMKGDPLDGFDQLYSGNDSGPAFSVLDSSPTYTTRLGYSPAQNCNTCGCQSGSPKPNCNSSLNICTVAAPSSPTGLSVSNLNYESMRLNWSPSAGGAGSEIWWKPQGSSDFTLLTTYAPGISSHNLSGLINNTNYCFKIRSWAVDDQVGNIYSGYSSQLCQKTLARVPQSPTGLSASATDIIYLSWSNSSQGVENNRIEIQTGGTGPFVFRENAPGTSTHWGMVGLNASTYYCFRMQAINVAGQSAYSNVSCARTAAPLCKKGLKNCASMATLQLGPPYL